MTLINNCRIAYGRFVLVHSGHEKLFQLADRVCVSNAPPQHIAKLNRMYNTLFVSKVGSPFRWLSEYKNVDLIVGADNELLAQKLKDAKLIETYTLISRPDGSPSSSEIRRMFEQGASAAKLYQQGYFSSADAALYAFHRFNEGY